MKWHILKRRDKSITTHTYHNWWKAENENSWLERFSRKRNIPPLNFSSVFGDRQNLKIKEKHVFFSCENLQDRFEPYSDHLKGIAHLRLGFDHIEDHDYLRFPLWLIYFTDPESDSPGRDFVRLMSREWRGPRPINCSLIARHDKRGNGAGLRKLAGETLETITDIQYAGEFKNNTNSLTRLYDNHTDYYLRDCKFNICLENSNHTGYVTEKIWRPILNGAIPIYWGSNSMPEPQVLLQSSFIPFHPKHPNKCASQVKELLQDQLKWEDFVNQRKVTDQAADWIDNKLNELTVKLRSL